MLAEHQHFPSHLCDNSTAVFRPAVLQDVLYDVVAILILNQTLCLLQQLLQDRVGLLWYAVLQNTLYYTATIRV